MVKQIDDQLLDAVETELNNFEQNAPFDKTVQGRILASLGGGLYSVSINNITYKVSSVDKNAMYAVGDIVKVIIQQNDYNKLYIPVQSGSIQVPTAEVVQANLEEHENNTDIHTNISEKAIWNAKLDSNSDGSNLTNTFSAATSRTNLTTGEKISISLGKIVKWFSDLKAVAFSGSYNDLSSKPSIPSALSDLSDDASHRIVTDTEKSTWNGKQNALSGDVTSHYHSYDRNRANHTGTQTSSTISDFSSAVSGNSDVSANTNARHTHSNKTVLDNTTASYTTDEKSKLSGIETGANKYTHPTGDGYSHIPVTNTTNNGKVLTAGSTENSAAWVTPTVAWGNITNKPTSSVSAIDSAVTNSHTHSNKSILDATTASYTTVDKTKLSGIQDGANNYILPVASDSILGGIKVGANLSVATDGTLNANDNPASFIIREERFIATAGQTVFTLTKGTYEPNANRIFWYWNRVKQNSDVLSETSSTTVTLPENIISAGDEILFDYIEVLNADPLPIHGSEHLSDGIDPIPNATGSKNGLMSPTDKVKLDGIDTSADVNKIETIQQNGTALPISNKTVNITVPTKVSDITNDTGFITSSSSITGNAATATKLSTERTINLTGDVTGSTLFNGSSDVSITATVADNSHNHTASNISDVTATASELNTMHGITASTSELNKIHGVLATTTELNYIHGVTSDIQTQLNGKEPSITKNTAFNQNFEASTSNIKQDGTASVGTSNNVARADHVHPTDTSRLAASAYTASDVLTKIKTVDGTGSGLDADTVDGHDSSYFAPIASPALTGTPTAPTATIGTNTDQLATTKFVQNSLSSGGYGDMLKSVYDSNDDGSVDNADNSNKLCEMEVDSPNGIATLDNLKRVTQLPGYELQTVTTDNVILNGTRPEGKLDIVMNGRTYQPTSALGKNLLPNSRKKGDTATIYGVSYTVNADKTITANGAATNYADYYLCGGATDDGSFRYPIKAGTYCWKSTSGIYQAHTFVIVRTSIGNLYWGSYTGPQTISSDCYIFGVCVRVEINYSVSNYVFTPLMSLTDIAYEPFTPDSPSPDYPAPISGSQYLQIASGKNLFHPQPGTVTANGVTCTVAEDGTITLDGTATASTTIECSPVLKLNAVTNNISIAVLSTGLKYTMSRTDVSGTHSSAVQYGLMDTGGTAYPANRLLSSTDQSTTFTAGQPIVPGGSVSSSVGLCFIFFTSDMSFTGYKFRLQFEQSDVATPWEPFKGLQFIQLPQPLYSLPDGMADSYDAVSGSGTANILAKTYNGTEAWYKAAIDTTNLAGFGITERQSGNKNILCDRLNVATVAMGSAREQIYVNTASQVFVRVLKSRLAGWSDSWTDAQKVAALKTWLSANPVTVLYALATPQAISGTEIDILPYQDNTYISNDQNATMNVAYSEYPASFRQGIKADNALPASSYTANDILNKLKTVDGTDSGLDSDLLGGNNSSFYKNIQISSTQPSNQRAGDLWFQVV